MTDSKKEIKHSWFSLFVPNADGGIVFAPEVRCRIRFVEAGKEKTVTGRHPELVEEDGHQFVTIKPLFPDHAKTAGYINKIPISSIVMADTAPEITETVRRKKKGGK